MENENKQREIFELNILDMQLRQLEQQAMALEQQIIELQTVLFNLDELKKAAKNQNMLFPFSRDVFIEGKAENPNTVLVNVGSKVMVKKTVEDAKKIVEKQKDQLIETSYELQDSMQRIIARITELDHKVNCDNPEHDENHHHHH